jgi:hypothetical protein
VTCTGAGCSTTRASTASSTCAQSRTYAPEAPQTHKQRTHHDDHAAQTEPCAEAADLRQRLLFYQEHVFPSPGAEEAVARLLAENARQQAELCDLRQKLAVYHELCVCLDGC